MENEFTFRVFTHESHSFYCFTIWVLELYCITQIYFRNICNLFAMFLFENVRLSRRNIDKKYDNFCCYFCQHCLQICNMLPFFHSHCFEIKLFWWDLFICQNCRHYYWQLMICWNFFYLFVLIRYLPFIKREYFQDFWIKLNKIIPCSSKFRKSIIDFFKFFPHFFRNKDIISILNDIMSEYLLEIAFKNFVVNFFRFISNVAMDEIIIFGLGISKPIDIPSTTNDTFFRFQGLHFQFSEG